MAKLLILSRDADEYERLIESAQPPDLDFTTEPRECDVVLGEPKLIRDQLPVLSSLKWAQSIYAGVEPLVDPAQRRDYILTNARGVFGELMSEYVFGYLLFHEKKMLERIQTQQTKQWQRPESGLLRGKTMGLLGVGSIGAHLAGTAKHFGMSVKGFTRRSETSTQVDRYYHGDDLLRFADGLDYLVCVLPRTDDTNKVVDANLLNALPSHAIFINVGRGNAVDESALVNALNEGKLAAAVLDVFEKEPLPEDHPFWTTPNLYMTFHTSAISYPEDITKLFVENYQLYIKGKPLKYVVDFERGYQSEDLTDLQKGIIMPPTLNDIREAAKRIKPYAHRTPVLTNESLNQVVGAQVFLKCENLQKVGAFKFRGACNAVFSLSDEEAACGVSTHSSGNHAQALALAARLRGIPAYIVMPESAPAVKKAAVAGYGGQITFCEPTLEAREATLRQVVEKTGATVVHPYNDARVIAGQGTAALELLEELPDLDVIIAPVGGGGLLSGTSIAATESKPGIRVIAGEPELADDAYRSIKAGEIMPPLKPKTIADGLLTSLGTQTFPIIQERVEQIVTVSERGIIDSMRFIWERAKIVIEPSAAVAVGVLWEKKIDLSGLRVGVILSGGNVDLEKLPWQPQAFKSLDDNNEGN